MIAIEQKRARWRAANKRYRERHPDRFRASMKKWRDANPDKVRAAGRKWEAANRERRNALERERRRANPERARQENKAWREANRDYVAAKNLEWRLRNPERYLANIKRWQKANPELMHEYKARRRARMAGATKVDRVLREHVLRRNRGRCIVCGRRVDPRDFVVDHVVALARGGQHVPGNLAPAHRVCNSIKKDRPLHVAREAVRQRLEAT